MTEKKRAAIYCRVAGNDDSVLELQAAELKRCCDAKGMTITNIYEDKCSANQPRPGLRQMLGDAHAQLFDAVIVLSASRIARDTGHLLQILSELEQAKVNVIFADGFENTLPLLRMARRDIHA